MRTMKLLATMLGVLIATIGLVGMAAPSVPLEVGRALLTPTTLYVVAAIRIAVGAFLLWAASVSRFPKVLRVIGTIVVVAGLLTPFFGVERVQDILTWWASQGQLFMRTSMSLVVIVGAFIIYAFVSPHRRA